MSECTHDCESCASGCSEQKPDLAAKQNEYSNIRHVIGVVSGKGGVGKSLVSGLIACALAKKGHKVAILDADITGPSVPRMFGLTENAQGSEQGIYPVKTSGGIEVMSINLLLENASDPVLWRGPIIGGTVKQFYTDVVWGEVDYMIVDMPPGTGDVALSVFQSLPVTGVVIVTSPQELVSMIVGKAVRMAELMDIPVIGVVENFSYMNCPDCGKKIELFGKSGADEVARDFELPVLARLPLDPAIAAAVDRGEIEKLPLEEIASAAAIIEGMG